MAGGINERQATTRGLGAATRATALAASVMDLHVRMALQEVDREKRRLISGGSVPRDWWRRDADRHGGWRGGSGALDSAGLGAFDDAGLLAMAVANLVLAGISLRIGGQVLKGPFLPQTLEGIMKTVRALLGR